MSDGICISETDIAYISLDIPLNGNVGKTVIMDADGGSEGPYKPGSVIVGELCRRVVPRYFYVEGVVFEPDEKGDHTILGNKYSSTCSQTQITLNGESVSLQKPKIMTDEEKVDRTQQKISAILQDCCTDC
jgi:hypothetical protein